MSLSVHLTLTRYSHIFTNPTAYIVVLAEHAAAKILALGASNGGKPTTAPTASPTVKPTSTPAQSSAKPTTTGVAKAYEQ